MGRAERQFARINGIGAYLLNGEFFSGVEQVVMTLMHYHKRIDARVMCLMKGEIDLSSETF